MADALSRLEHAVALLNAGRAPEALGALRALAASRPGDPGVARVLARALALTGEFEQGAFHARRALKAWPEDAQSLDALARALLGLGRCDEAVGVYERAAAGAPDDPDTGAALCAALQAAGRYASATEAARRGLERAPTHPGLRLALAGALIDTGRSREAWDALGALAKERPDDYGAATTRCHASVYASGLTPAQAREPFDAFGDLLERLAPSRAPVYRGSREPERRLRVGFISPDLRAHPVGTFMEAALTHLDREAFDVVVYSTAYAEDAVSARLRALPLRWVRAGALDANALARTIFADGVDVLVELSGHSAGHRLAALHARPAPVQATYLGFPSTTGARAIGWRLVDSLTDPPGNAEAWGHERLARVDPCFLCYRPPLEHAPPIAPDRRGRERRPIVFGSCNSVSKLNDDVVRAWARLLRETPGSVLLLKHVALGHEEGCALLAARFGAEGLGPDRLDLRGPSDYRSLLDTYNEIDVALDPFPFNGATTTCDALFMGVPVVSFAGDRSCARVGLSVLTAAGEPGLCAPDLDGCLVVARALAADAPRLRGYRAGLRDRLLASALCDAPAFGARFGAALRMMWREYCGAHG